MYNVHLQPCNQNVSTKLPKQSLPAKAKYEKGPVRYPQAWEIDYIESGLALELKKVIEVLEVMRVYLKVNSKTFFAVLETFKGSD